MKTETTPKTTAACWNCGHVNPTHVLPEVRKMKCDNPKCDAVLPSESEEEFLERKAHFNLSDRTLAGAFLKRS